ncbi:hypothetical protein ACJX0J_013436, partial [Zea mays]
MTVIMGWTIGLSTSYMNRVIYRTIDKAFFIEGQTTSGNRFLRNPPVKIARKPPCRRRAVFYYARRVRCFSLLNIQFYVIYTIGNLTCIIDIYMYEWIFIDVDTRTLLAEDL